MDWRGEVLMPMARRILADVELAQAQLKALNGLRRGRLRLVQPILGNPQSRSSDFPS